MARVAAVTTHAKRPALHDLDPPTPTPQVDHLHSYRGLLSSPRLNGCMRGVDRRYFVELGGRTAVHKGEIYMVGVASMPRPLASHHMTRAE